MVGAGSGVHPIPVTVMTRVQTTHNNASTPSSAATPVSTVRPVIARMVSRTRTETQTTHQPTRHRWYKVSFRR
jgi:hypothetical protein